MCGRYVQSRDGRQLSRQIAAELGDEVITPSWNAAPTQRLPVITVDDHGRHLQTMHWGFLPDWAQGKPIINAQAESVARKPTFREAVLARRCLVPLDGFYEWRRAARARQPMYFGGKAPLAAAGIWEAFAAEGEEAPCFTILTTRPNELVAPVHDRMPVLLPAEHWDEWLESGDRGLAELARPFPAEQLWGVPVSDRVNRVRNNDPSCCEPLLGDQQSLF